MDRILMPKPATRQGYDDAFTAECERLLVTLLRGLGPWKDSEFLVGGLTPRYLVPDRPPFVPPHAGTLDVDVVIDLQILADTDAYATLEQNLKRLGFERATNDRGQVLRRSAVVDHLCSPEVVQPWNPNLRRSGNSSLPWGAWEVLRGSLLQPIRRLTFSVAFSTFLRAYRSASAPRLATALASSVL